MDVKEMQSNQFFIASLILMVASLIFSVFGITIFKVDLSVISENSILGVFIYITFLIMLVERVVETYNSTYRKPGRLEIADNISTMELQLDEAVKAGKKDVVAESKVQLEKLKNSLNSYIHETRCRTLLFSFSLGGVLACLGCANVLTPFLDETLNISFFSTSVFEFSTINFIDVISVWITAAVVAGGSDGWNSITHWFENAAYPKKV